MTATRHYGTREAAQRAGLSFALRGFSPIVRGDRLTLTADDCTGFEENPVCVGLLRLAGFTVNPCQLFDADTLRRCLSLMDWHGAK